MAEQEGIEVLLQVAPEEPIVEEGRFLLVGEVGLDDPVEEFRVPLQEEEIQFVADVLGILLTLFIVLHAGPVEDELELTQGGIIPEGEQEVVNVAQVVEYAQAGGRRVGQLEGLPRVHHRHALLLGIDLFRIEVRDHSQFAPNDRRLGQGHHGGSQLDGISRHYADLTQASALGKVELYETVIVWFEIGCQEGTFLEEVEAGEIS